MRVCNTHACAGTYNLQKMNFWGIGAVLNSKGIKLEKESLRLRISVGGTVNYRLYLVENNV